MTSYAIGHLHDVRMNADIVAYLEGIDATLKPYGGRFVLHGGHKQDLEGQFAGDLIVIAFPDRQAAQGWYDSPAYQALIPLRRRNALGAVFLIDGVDKDHRATDILQVPA